MEVFRDYLSQQGLKATPERLATGRVVFTFIGAFTIDELQKKVDSLGWPISKPTLYRTMSLLEDALLVKTIYDRESGQKMFVTTSETSFYGVIICSKCKKTIEVDSEHFNDIYERLCLSYDFNEITSFSFTLEGYCAECADDSDPKAKLHARPLKDKKSPRVLIFDNETIILDLLERYLENSNYSVLTFADPSDWKCLAIDNHRCPLETEISCGDVILTDINMTTTTGIEFVQWLVEKRCNINNIAFMTGGAQEEQLQFIESNGYKLFKKPFDLEEFQIWIDTCTKEAGCKKLLPIDKMTWIDA